MIPAPVLSHVNNQSGSLLLIKNLQERLEVLRFGKVYLSAERGFIHLMEAVKTNIALNPTVNLRYPILLILLIFPLN